MFKEQESMSSIEDDPNSKAYKTIIANLRAELEAVHQAKADMELEKGQREKEAKKLRSEQKQLEEDN